MFVMEIQCAFCEVGTEFLNIFLCVWVAARIHRPLRVIAFNANGIWRRRCELSKQLQDLHIDVAVLSETHLKSHERFFIPNYHFCRTDRFPGRKDVPHKHVYLCYMCDLTKAKPLHKRRCYVRTMTARVQLPTQSMANAWRCFIWS
jgi:endonuclease/exonuclease/phosphatase (EEP) superfamily protein YafD